MSAALGAQLAEEFAGVFARQTVEQCLDDSCARLLPASIVGFLPPLAQRFARERLRAAARLLPSAAAERQPLALFVCTGNSGRSQMAAALLRQRSQGAVEIASAGTQPREQVQLEALVALDEWGVATSDRDSCPALPGRRYLDWDVADPAGADLATVRAIRDDIARHVSDLLADLGTATPATR